MTLLAWIGVGAFGALGAYARYLVGSAISTRRPSAFPVGTLVVNLSGGFALGVLTGLAVSGDALLVLGTGLLGAYTTFSTWMVEAQRLGEDGDSATMWHEIRHRCPSRVLGLAPSVSGTAHPVAESRPRGGRVDG